MGLQLDPGQVDNYLDGDMTRYTKSYQVYGRPIDRVVDRLDALLMVLKSCKAQSCLEPWAQLHPDGSVKTLRDALGVRLDGFYREQPKISFKSCELGYLKYLEGPQEVNVFVDEAFLGDHDEL